ncbi:2,5-diketo-D-gluconate reductase A [Corynebacterium appendicis CIP 107643]|uniref:2,5-diketo-D-gluconate reductase A n=1 Tax=Corynebacterium appendicis CIP 107643 TaxID=1161099 RepID=A0A1N7JYJ5_9CORY|nr:aldo/keto reductase [Corynebacterium appendicis]WJY60565.1 putative oxidoreductase [Corynebacterium appendicis CIP 107643]SIS54316.1 2,5-diketo-D-gluconate reductase A [Corynebacterium appendicis CIP 107643]
MAAAGVFELSSGATMPRLGLGTYKLDGPASDTVALIRRAIELGYRHIDTASLYGNEEAVGQALNDAIRAGDVTREDLFVTSKVWNDDQFRAAEAFGESLTRLGLEYLDLFMVHWPWPQNGTFVDAYRALIEVRDRGDLISVGVANFYEEALDEIIDATGISPAVNQVELHTGFTQPELREYHAKHGILTEAWAPLGRGEILSELAITEIAEAHDATPGQVALAHLLAHGISVIPKTANPERLVENFGALDVALSDGEVARLDQVQGHRQSKDPREFPG